MLSLTLTDPHKTNLICSLRELTRASWNLSSLYAFKVPAHSWQTINATLQYLHPYFCNFAYYFSLHNLASKMPHLRCTLCLGL